MSEQELIFEELQCGHFYLKGTLAGVDEVGRGPLAGNVVAAAVILDPNNPIDGLSDSKKLSEKKRDNLYDVIQEQALSYAIAWASPEEIDAYNILQASLIAMHRAVNALHISPDIALIDGNRCPEAMPCAAVPIVKGDSKIEAISAASILAKVYRDREMLAQDKTYPGYGLAKHKGYPTKGHMEALAQLGPTPIHRKSFGPVAKLISNS